MLSNWTATAFNQVPDSANQIHGDEVAREYGFKGGLVPGVTQSAYLCHPGLCAWGDAWLARGIADIKVVAPLYDGETFTVTVSDAAPDSYQAQLRGADGRVCANGTMTLPADADPSVPARRGDPLAGQDWQKPLATPAAMRQLQQSGCMAFAYDWQAGTSMQTYLASTTELPTLVRPDKGGFANSAFILSCANWALADNAQMNPWVHMATRSQHFAPLPLNTRVIAEMQVTDVFTRKGHEFVDVRVDVFGAGDVCHASIEQRAIYRLRGL